MKRTVACILMTVVILLSLLVPTGAQTTSEEPSGVEPIPEPYRNSVALWSADESFGGQFEIDTQNQLEGLGCASVDLSVPEGKHVAQRSIEPVDATGLDTLEFDIYLSDTGIIPLFVTALRMGDLEIASKKEGKIAALHLDLQRLFSIVHQSEPQIGWNHVIIPFEKMSVYYGEIDYSCLNHISMCWVKYENVPQDTILKFDNFRLTDRQAVAKEQKEQGENEELKYVMQLAVQHAELLADMQRFSHASMEFPEEFITNPSLDPAPLLQKYEELHSQYRAIPTGDRQLLNQYFDYYYDMRRGISNVEQYARAQAAFPYINDIIAQVRSLAQYTEESRLTRANYRSICDQVEKLNEEIDALTTSLRGALAQQGYIATLKDVEKVVRRHTHRYARLPDEASLAHAATCTQGALYYKQCELCGALDKTTFESGEPTGHTPISDFPFSAGERGHGPMCRDCLVFLDPEAHDFTDWEILSEATPTQDGVSKRRCLTCTYVETQTLNYVAPEVPDEPEPDEPSDKGCSAVLPGGVGLCLVLIVPAAAVLRKKKK